MYGAFRFVSNLSSHVVVGLAGLRIPMAVGLTILEVFGMSGRWSLGASLWCCVVCRHLVIIDVVVEA